MTPSQIAYECQRSIELARLGYLLANERLELFDAYCVMQECRKVTNEWPLINLDLEGVLLSAAYRWSNSADEIRVLAKEACERVHSKYDSDGETRSAAEEWAMDLIAEYAEADGIVLVEGEREEEGI